MTNKQNNEQMKQIIITTNKQVLKFDNPFDFMIWDELTTEHIESYHIDYKNGNEAGNKGINASACLYDILEEEGHWNQEMQASTILEA